jgi:similar to stage IV sporulation protein
MVSLKLSRWLIGYARFRVIGGGPERFYTACARAGIYLWDIAPGKNAGATAAARKYKKMRHIARRCGCRLRVYEKRGLPFALRRTRGHPGLWAGGAAFLLIVFLLSLRVWCVQVTGDCPYPVEEVKSALAAEGLSIGAWKNTIEPKTLADKLMLRFPDIRWMSVNLRGSAAEIAIQRKVRKPQIAEFSDVCNIKAAATGQIVSMKVYAGTPTVKKGDAVVEGQLLVSAVVEDQLGGSTLVHASAEIVAETTHDLTADVTLQQTRTVPTGRVILRRNLDLFGASLPVTLQRKPGAGWNVSRTAYDVSLFGTPLPLSLYEERWDEVRTENFLLTKDEARALAKKEVTAKTEPLLKNGKILASQSTEKWTKNHLTLSAHLNCEENIALESPIFIKEK